MKAILKQQLGAWLSVAPIAGNSYDDKRLFDTIKLAYQKNALDTLLSIDLGELLVSSDEEVGGNEEWGEPTLCYVEKLELMVGVCTRLMDYLQEEGVICDCRGSSNELE